MNNMNNAKCFHFKDSMVPTPTACTETEKSSLAVDRKCTTFIRPSKFWNLHCAEFCHFHPLAMDRKMIMYLED